MRFSLSPVEPLDGEAVLPLGFAKAHLRVQHEFEDDLIAVYRDGAVAAVEQYTGRSLAPRSYLWVGRFGPRVELGIGPRATEVSVKYIDQAGVQQIPTPEEFPVWIGPHNTINRENCEPWPATADGDGVVEITFTAGYAAGLIPADLVQAARLMLATFYANRESVVVGVNVEELPLGFCRLCAPYRMLRV